MRKRRIVRRSRYTRPDTTTTREHSKLREGWHHYREMFDSIIPPPTLFSQSESEGSLEMGLVKIPALLLYTPIYYILFLLLAILLYPWIALFS